MAQNYAIMCAIVRSVPTPPCCSKKQENLAQKLGNVNLSSSSDANSQAA